MGFSAPNGDVDLADLLAGIGRYLARVRALAADLDYAGWRHEQEPSALIALLLNARSRAEEARLFDPARRARDLRLIVNALPLARLEQLLMTPSGIDNEAA